MFLAERTENKKKYHVIITENTLAKILPKKTALSRITNR